VTAGDRGSDPVTPAGSSSAAPHPVERAVARIDLAAIEHNAAHLRSQLTAGAKLCAVVKAGAYGHGDVWCAKAAVAGGAEWLAVAAASEAVDLRRHGIAEPILIMGALTASDARAALEAAADVVAWEPAFAEALARTATADGVTGRVHVKLDSGMGRLGTKDAEQALATARVVAEAEHLQLVGLMTHFATADEPGDEHFPNQVEIFTTFADRFRAEYPGVVVHAANSAAVFRDPAAHFDMARCGVALYGLDPFQEDAEKRGLRPALTLESYVAAVRRFEPGESAGYGRRWVAAVPTWVGTIPIGYGDGFRRAFTNNAEILIGGRGYPLVGTVSMDNVTVDLGPETDVEPGALATLIGEQDGKRISAEELAHRIDTLNYEITCGLLPRVRRVWSSA
jgi:alanine racemase